MCRQSTDISPVGRKTYEVRSSLSGILNVVSIWCLVLDAEILGQIWCLSEPVGQLGQLLAKTIYRLLIHVGLGQQLWKGDYDVLVYVLGDYIMGGTYQGDGRSALDHRYHQQPFQREGQLAVPRRDEHQDTDYAQIYAELAEV